MAILDKNIQVLMLKGEKGDMGDAGDYSTLQNKPKINNVTLDGSKSADDLGLVESGELDSITADIGTLENLDTTVKTSLVNAINEVNGKTVPVTQGGTGGTTPAAARQNLGVMTSYVLYNSQEGTNGNIDFTNILSEIEYTLSDFKFLEFYFSNGNEDDRFPKDDGMCMAKVYKWNDQALYFDNTINLSMQGSTTVDNTTYFALGVTRYDVGKSEAPNMAVRNTNKSVEMVISKTNGNLSNWNMSVNHENIRVFKVVGYI